MERDAKLLVWQQSAGRARSSGLSASLCWFYSPGMWLTSRKILRKAGNKAILPKITPKGRPLVNASLIPASAPVFSQPEDNRMGTRHTTARTQVNYCKYQPPGSRLHMTQYPFASGAEPGNPNARNQNGEMFLKTRPGPMRGAYRTPQCCIRYLKLLRLQMPPDVLAQEVTWILEDQYEAANARDDAHFWQMPQLHHLSRRQVFCATSAPHRSHLIRFHNAAESCSSEFVN